MRKELFINKILSDERVVKCGYDNRFGYEISLKEGHGVIERTRRSHYMNGYHCGYSEEIIVRSSNQFTKQSLVESWLMKVEKINLEEIKKENKKCELKVFSEELHRIDIEIKIAEEKITKLKRIRKDLREKIKEYEVE